MIKIRKPKPSRTTRPVHTFKFTKKNLKIAKNKVKYWEAHLKTGTDDSDIPLTKKCIEVCKSVVSHMKTQRRIAKENKN